MFQKLLDLIITDPGFCTYFFSWQPGWLWKEVPMKVAARNGWIFILSRCKQFDWVLIDETRDLETFLFLRSKNCRLSWKILACHILFQTDIADYLINEGIIRNISCSRAGKSNCIHVVWYDSDNNRDIDIYVSEYDAGLFGKQEEFCKMININAQFLFINNKPIPEYDRILSMIIFGICPPNIAFCNYRYFKAALRYQRREIIDYFLEKTPVTSRLFAKMIYWAARSLNPYFIKWIKSRMGKFWKRDYFEQIFTKYFNQQWKIISPGENPHATTRRVLIGWYGNGACSDVLKNALKMNQKYHS